MTLMNSQDSPEATKRRAALYQGTIQNQSPAFLRTELCKLKSRLDVVENRYRLLGTKAQQQYVTRLRQTRKNLSDAETELESQTPDLRRARIALSYAYSELIGMDKPIKALRQSD